MTDTNYFQQYAESAKLLPDEREGELREREAAEYERWNALAKIEYADYVPERCGCDRPYKSCAFYQSGYLLGQHGLLRDEILKDRSVEEITSLFFWAGYNDGRKWAMTEGLM